MSLYAKKLATAALVATVLGLALGFTVHPSALVSILLGVVCGVGSWVFWERHG